MPTPHAKLALGPYTNVSARPRVNRAARMPSLSERVLHINTPTDTSALDGRPLYVGGTDMTPELAFQNDHNSHNGVRSLARGGGTAKVVWAAVGSGSVGYEQMRAAREAVAANRSTRQRVQELSSAKPYSYHSHRMVR